MPHVVIFRAIPIGSYDKAQYPILDVRTLQDFALDDVVTASRLVEDHAAAYPVPLKVGLGGSILMTGRVSSDFASFTTFQTCFLELAWWLIPFRSRWNGWIHHIDSIYHVHVHSLRCDPRCLSETASSDVARIMRMALVEGAPLSVA